MFPVVPASWEGQWFEGFPQDLLFVEEVVRFASPPSAVMLPAREPLIPAAFLEYG